MSIWISVSGSGSYGDLALTFEACTRKAYMLGQVVVLPTPSQLFLDIDSKEQFEHFLAMLPKVAQNEDKKTLPYTVTASKDGGHHFHITVDMGRPLAAIERIAYQAILGSDPVREIIAIRRVNAGNPNPTVFFENGEIK